MKTFSLPGAWRMVSLWGVMSMSWAWIAYPALAEKAGTGLVVHEWGTFTQVSGSDGQAVKWWTPALVDAAELPPFVERNLLAAKIGSPATLRMETPVVYFYPPKAMKVQVTVNWRDGQLTEWFPAPKTGIATSEGVKWELSLFPPDAPQKEKIPLVDTKGEHYAHARGVADAWLVRGERDQTLERIAPARQPQWEKFLFYRGAGQGGLPLRVSSSADGSGLHLVNPGGEVVLSPVVVQVVGGRLSWKQLGDLKAWNGEGQAPEMIQQRPLPSAPGAGAEAELAETLAAQLVRHGLFEAEARAMVATWRDSWLKEEGLRVLSVLPRAWVDHVLPLTIQPQPAQLERVFVARHEILLPAVESGLLGMLKADRPAAALGSQLQALKLGRFENAALERAITLETARMRDQFRQIHTAALQSQARAD